MNVIFVKEEELSETQKQQVETLAKECFDDVSSEEVEEDFIAESFGRLLALDNDQVIGMLRLFKREVEFKEEKIILGGMGGVCVTEKMRGQGIATEMLKKGLNILKEQGVDVACLNVNRGKEAYMLYERLGFKFLNRDISFEDADGKIKQDGDSMFMPINSEEKYHKVMNSKSIFHQGKGYW